MKNTSPPLIPRPDRPVDPITIPVIREIHKASLELGLPVMLVGATARIILLENIFGLNVGRTTNDIDFAFALDNWPQFEAFKAHLVKHANFEEAKGSAQRLFVRLPELKHRHMVDLIPFGNIEATPGHIAWPPDMSFIMNVTGFADALAASLGVTIAPGLTIQIASLPGIAMLKIFAWSDRGQEDPKDASDLILLLRGYHEAGNSERIYEEAITTMEAVGYNIELAGAWLLGRDAAAIALPVTAAKLIALLEGNDRRRLIEDMAKAMRGQEDAIEQADQLLVQFTKGFKES